MADDFKKEILLHNLMNRVDVEKDGTKFSGTNVIRAPATEPFHRLANQLFDTANLARQIPSPLTAAEQTKYDTRLLSGAPSYDTRRDFLDTEINNYRQMTSHKVNICRLDYFQNPDKNKLKLPSVFEDVERLDGYHLKYAIQDSGKDPQAFDPAIKPLITPGSYLDPASRSTQNVEQYMTNLNEDDFRKVGLAHLITEMTTVPIGPNKLEITVTLTGMASSTPLRFGIGPNINKPEENFATYPDNIYLFGNNTKNKFFLDNSDKIITDEQTKRKAVGLILMKLLGDMLQSYFGVKRLDEGGAAKISKQQICAFTCDKVFADRAALFEFPCIVQDYEQSKKGSDHNVYNFYKYKENIRTIRRVNRFMLKKVIKDNTQIIQRLNLLIDGGHAIDIGGKQKTLMPEAMDYLKAVRSSIKLVNSSMTPSDEIPSSSPLPEIVLNFDEVPTAFEKEVTKYRASDLVKVGRTITPFTANIVFSLLPRNHPLNKPDEDYKDRPTQHFRDFIARYSLEERRRSRSRSRSRERRRDRRGANERYQRERRGADEPRERSRSRSRSRERRRSRSRSRSRTRGGNPVNKFVEILNKDQPDKAVNAVISEIIPHDSITTPEDIATILYPYFHHLGKFSINPDFYREIIPKINESIQREDDSKFTFDIFERIYEAVHETPKSDIVDDDSDMNILAVKFREESRRTPSPIRRPLGFGPSHRRRHTTHKSHKSHKSHHLSAANIKTITRTMSLKRPKNAFRNLSKIAQSNPKLGMRLMSSLAKSLKSARPPRQSFAKGTRFGSTRRAASRALSTVREGNNNDNL